MTKRNHAITASILLLAVLAMTGMQTAAAVSPQWFPAIGTTNDYTLTFQATFINGTTRTCTTVNVVNASGSMWFSPTILNEIFMPHEIYQPFIENGTTLTARVSYTEKSSTELYRAFSLITAADTYNEAMAGLSLYWVEGGGGAASLLSLDQQETVPKSNFLTTTSNFVDYLDASKGLGEEILPSVMVTSAVDGEVIAQHETTFRYKTYFADAAGRVKQYVFANYNTSSLASMGLYSTQYIFTAAGGSILDDLIGTFTNSSSWLALGIVFGVAFIVGIGIGATAKRKK